MSLLDAAYEVLKRTGFPMSPSDMIVPILDSGAWTTKGKTPAQTLGARLYVDIKKLGAKSRFVNAGNGRFTLSGVKTDESLAQASLPGLEAKSVAISPPPALRTGM